MKPKTEKTETDFFNKPKPKTGIRKPAKPKTGWTGLKPVETNPNR